jgi:hypothetical protein
MIKILFLAASPIDQRPLRLGKEISEIQARLRATDHGRIFSFECETAAQASELPEYFQRVKPQIVHFSGHGSQSGECFLEDEMGWSQRVPGETLRKLFEIFKDKIRCVVLSACYSKIQAQTIAESVDCVIGMSKEISDKAAIAFSAGFYQTLGFGRNIKEAFDLGRIQIELDLGTADESCIPQLILSQNARPESISLVRRRTEKEIAAVPVVAKILGPVEEYLKKRYKSEDQRYAPESDLKKMDILFDSLVKLISESKLHECISNANQWELSEELKNYYSNHSQLPHSVRILQAFLGKDSPLDLKKEDIDELYPVIPGFLDAFRYGLTKWSELRENIDRKEQQLNQPRFGLPEYIRNYFTIIQDRTKIFGGRSEEMSQIESFIRSDEPGYLVIEGKSGMGKTSLLANIVDKFPVVAYHFFSIAASSQESDLTKASPTIHSIGQQMEFIKNGWVDIKQQYSRETLLKLLQEGFPYYTHPVLILDGLDEAENVEFLRGFFPKQLKDRLKVIFSYRSLAEQGVSQDYYLLKLGLSRRDIRSFIILDSFSRDRIAELFDQLAGEGKAGFENHVALTLVKRIADEEKLLHQITEKSEGDPFYLRFLVEDIRSGDITENNILEIPNGLKEYLKLELENLYKRADGEVSIDVIGIISADDEAWPEEDLIETLKTDYGYSDLTRTKFRNKIIPSIRRYLYQVSLGKDRHDEAKLAYTIIHPRLKEYFAEMLG